MRKFIILTLGLVSSVAVGMVTKNGAIAQVPIETTDIENSTIPNPRQPNEVILTNPNPRSPVSADQRFSCQSQNGQYTVMYQPQSQPGQLYPWAVPGVMGGGWSSQRRCNEISRRLEQYRPDGLVEMRTGVENGYNVICATTDKNSACRIVLTVPVGADPNNIRDRVFANLTTADSGQNTIGVNTFVQGNRSQPFGGLFSTSKSRNSSRNNGIDLKPFLDPIDGGTGAEIGASRGLRFKPSGF